MYSYIYYDATHSPKRINVFHAAETEAEIKEIALKNISRLVGDYMPAGNNSLVKEIEKALVDKNTALAMDLWDRFAKQECQLNIVHHSISQFQLTE